MKTLLFFENQKAIKVSGIGRAMRHQKQALTLAGVPYTMNPKDTFDIAHINTIFLESYHVLKTCKRKHIPVIVHGHSTLEDFKHSFKGYQLMAVWFNHQLLKVYKHADLIITPTLYSKGLIDHYHLGVKVIAISNGIDLQEYAYDEKKVQAFKDYFHLTTEKVVIGIGLLFARKGIHDFFEIARRNPEITFIWFGHLADALVSNPIKKAIKNRPANALMPGYIDNDIIKGAYHYAECLMFTSYEETEGIVVLEALASRCPVLCRDIGVYEDWLKDGRDCYKAQDNASFDQKLHDIMTHETAAVVDAGYHLAEERSLSRVGQQLKEAYASLLTKS
jgi:1,2-diacylglycerol-3-alpha-glucose alpha-1,2-glucosyltransferase